MKLTDTTKTVGSIIAVMLIPLGVIAWNFYSGQNQTDDNQNLNIPEINEQSDASEIEQEDSGMKDSIETNNSETMTNEKAQDQVTKPGDAIGGIKTLPNTSKNPTPDE